MRIQETPMQTNKIGARDLLLLLIGLGDTDNRGLGGITRIQKLIYLLESEEDIRPEGDVFRFEPYKAGPYSPRIYDDLEFLENLDYMSRAGSGDNPEISAEASEPEKAEV